MDALQKLLHELSVLDAITRLPDKTILTTSEAAIFLRVSISTMERMRRDGNGPKYIQVGKDGARSQNQKCRYQKADLIDFLQSHKVSSSTESVRMRGLAFMPFRDPAPRRSEFDLVTKRPFYVDEHGHIVGSVEDTILQDVIERLGRSDIQWINPVLAAYEMWSNLVAYAQYSTSVKKSLAFAMERIDASVEEHKRV